MLTVLTWLWAQPGVRSAYGPEHVNIWADMVRRHLTLPHELACVTDAAEGLDPSIRVIAPPRDFEDVRIPTWGEHRPQCLRRLAMFRRDAGRLFGERIVCMDLDVVVAGPLDPLFVGGEDFRIFRGTVAARPYNGSMMMIRAGARPQVYEEFTPARAAEAGRRFVGSDQAWISHVLKGGETTWGPEDGVYWWRPGRDRAPRRTRLMFYPGTPKPWELVARNEDGWTVRNYRAADKPTPALVLGYGEHVWADLEAVLARGDRFGGVIASPEAAAHWPGRVLAVADDDGQALRLAHMHGFTRTLACGVGAAYATEAA